VLFTGNGTNGTMQFTLRDTAGDVIRIDTGFDLRFRVMDAKVAVQIVAEQTAIIVDDGTVALRGRFDVDLSAITISTASIQDNAVIVISNLVATKREVKVQKLVDIVEDGTD